MFPAPISPLNELVAANAELVADGTQDEVFGSKDAESKDQTVFEDMLALLTLLGASPEELEEMAVATQETPDAVEAIAGTPAVSEVANPLLTAPVDAVDVAGSLTPQATVGEIEPLTTSEAAPLPATAAVELDQGYFPAIEGPIAEGAASTAESAIEGVQQFAINEAVGEATEGVEKLSPTQQTLEALKNAAQTQTTSQHANVADEVEGEIEGEAELPATPSSEASTKSAVSKSANLLSGESEGFGAGSESEQLPLPQAVVALQAKVEELVADGDSNSSSQATMEPIVAANADVNASRMQPAQTVKVSEAMEVPIAEQVASHIASARLVKSEGKQELTITLDPPRLGTISLEIVDSNNVLVAKVTAAEPVALQTLQANLSSLLDSLERAGIEFDKFEFGHQDPQQQQNGHQRFDDERHDAINAPHSYGLTAQPEAEAEVRPGATPTTNKRLDITV